MEKIWYIKVNDNKEGPYSILDLKRHPLVTPDTLVWKKGFPEWIQMRNVPELQEVFADEEKDKPKKGEENLPIAGSGGEVVLTFRDNPPYFFFWLLIAILIFCYVLYQLYGFYGPK